ncbi:methyltransferase domain-containing protein [Microcoleus sp. N9_B2]|uniref:methyltransferase domain-containing protein n=1 Tax=unclassified Microcoleus TaxID=2642155 RepID=UPI002FD3F13A
MDLYAKRREIASQYLKGEGIEVGPLNAPLEVPAEVKVHYIDRMPVEELRRHYPELAGVNLAEVDIIDDGETLAGTPDNSWDFVIANHMIEHCQNPIGALENFLRVVKPGGIVYMGVPDKRYIFDRDRPLTSLDHLIRDYKEGPEWSRLSHFEEYVRLVEKFPEPQVASRVQALLDIDYSIHYHVWTPETFSELIQYFQQNLSVGLEVELFQENCGEFICIFRKILHV